jgi:hypothetical protein
MPELRIREAPLFTPRPLPSGAPYASSATRWLRMIRASAFDPLQRSG